jgi:hypothetical protein
MLCFDSVMALANEDNLFYLQSIHLQTAPEQSLAAYNLPTIGNAPLSARLSNTEVGTVDDTIQEGRTKYDLASMTGLLDAAVRLTIREPARNEKSRYQLGVKVESFDFQHTLSSVSPALWSPGYLKV